VGITNSHDGHGISYQAARLLEKKNGLDISTTYANDKSCNNFVAIIGEVMTEQLASEVNQKKYISVMIDGATDASGKENDTVHRRYVKDGPKTLESY